MGRRFFFIVATALAFLSAHASFAATDGLLDSTSTGEHGLSLTIPNLAKISGITDFLFGTYSGLGNPSLNRGLCVYTNAATGNYRVTAQGSGAGSAFTLVDGAAHTISYAVRWNNVDSTAGNFALTANSISAVVSGANTTSTSCAGGNTANVQVLLSQSALMNVPAGTYTGVLTLIIDPN